VLAGVAGGVLLAHAWLLFGWTGQQPPALHSAPVLLSLRQAPPDPTAEGSTTAETTANTTVDTTVGSTAHVPARHRPSTPVTTAPQTTPALAPQVEAPASLTVAEASPGAPLPSPDDPPVAAQDLAAIPPIGQGVWHYRLRQAGEEGRAWLQWQSGPDAYALELRRRLPSRALPGWRSEGSRDALGLAPQRFSVLKGAREAQALNFRRQQGLISYSASTVLQPLAPAAQDRLSWWLQLPALLQAWQAGHGAPLPGQRFEIPVALIRGGLHRWQFSVLGQEQGLWHLQRGALGPHDNRLDVWLDPARQFLPVRLHQQIGEEEGWEMELLDEPTGPERPAAA
jgi:hypothetical protein